MDTTEAIFDDLCQITGSEPDRKGEVWIPCPDCGREDDKFSFSIRGCHCFVCGASFSLKALQARIDARPREYTRPVVQHRSTRHNTHSPFSWQHNAARVLADFEACPDRQALWCSYRPFTVETIKMWHLGAGILPACRCKHERLIYPAFNVNDQIVAFRGRAMECACDKWLQSAGSKVTLWGGALVQYGARQTVIVCESPVDAMLAMQEEPGIVAVASTGGAGTWRDSWTEHLKRQEPAQVIVWYDNDLAGTPNEETRERLAAEWFEKHPKARKLPRQNGPWLFNKLARASLPVVLYRWPKGTEPKADLSLVLMK